MTNNEIITELAGTIEKKNVINNWQSAFWNYIKLYERVTDDFDLSHYDTRHCLDTVWESGSYVDSDSLSI